MVNLKKEYLTDRTTFKSGRYNNLKVLEQETPTAGDAIEIFCGIVNTPWGNASIGYHNTYICFIDFSNVPEKINDLKALIHSRWPAVYTVSTTKPEIDNIFEAPLLLLGTQFQRAVWKELLQIPKGQTKTYGQVASAIGKPGHARAVGQAVGANPIFYRVPCHRVLPAAGGLGGYRWGTTVKKLLLEEEGIKA